MSAHDVAPPKKSAAPSASEAPSADTTAAKAPAEETAIAVRLLQRRPELLSQ